MFFYHSAVDYRMDYVIFRTNGTSQTFCCIYSYYKLHFCMTDYKICGGGVAKSPYFKVSFSVLFCCSPGVGAGDALSEPRGQGIGSRSPQSGSRLVSPK